MATSYLYLCRARYTYTSGVSKIATMKWFGVEATNYQTAEQRCITEVSKETGFVSGSAWVSCIKRRNLSGFECYETNSGLVDTSEGYFYELYAKAVNSSVSNKEAEYKVFVVAPSVSEAKELVQAKINGSANYAFSSWNGYRKVFKEDE